MNQRLPRVHGLDALGQQDVSCPNDLMSRWPVISNSEHVYTPPRTLAANEVPPALLNYLNGRDLLLKTQAIRLSTVDVDGWPRAALLSAGDVLALPNGRIRFAIFANSGTTANLLRDGRLTLSMALDGGMYSLRMRARQCGQVTGEAPLALFETQVERARLHVASYADVSCGISFSLHEPATVLDRWERQIAALRAVS
ncbi:MAG: pyridoxamine 5-phosphate oxidase [Acidobacteria bacterium]|nr:pyridoxamine 5-phosphate oxidase [Acidobacteriota bacterium]